MQKYFLKYIYNQVKFVILQVDLTGFIGHGSGCVNLERAYCSPGECYSPIYYYTVILLNNRSAVVPEICLH